MKTTQLNLTGQWWGHFTYPNHLGPVTPFNAQFLDQAGRIVGATTEFDQFRPDHVIEAIISGHYHGESIDFTKAYQGAGPDYEQPIDYVGRISADGNVITGVWSLLEIDGRFEMRRDLNETEAAAMADAMELLSRD